MNDQTPVEHVAHNDRRANIPPAELEGVLDPRDKSPVRVAYERRNPDLDPQLVWRGKDLDQQVLAVEAPPIYLQEQVHPKAIIEDLRAHGRKDAPAASLFDHFGVTEEDREAEVEFYRHSKRWSNRMILGDSLAVMASLAEREGLRGQVQAIYIDPPYGIRFNSNFQWSTTSRNVKDGDLKHLTREPEQVKAFRDTWRDGIHSYLSYLRDRLVVARDLLTESGSCFVQIGDENVHRVRAVMDEVFGEENCVSLIGYKTTTGLSEAYLAKSNDYILWYSRDQERLKYRQVYKDKTLADDNGGRYRFRQTEIGVRKSISASERLALLQESSPKGIFTRGDLTSQDASETTSFPIFFEGLGFRPGKGHWKTHKVGLMRLAKADRLSSPTPNSVRYVRFLEDFAAAKFSNIWTDTQTGAFTDEKMYVVQTNTKVIERCLLMATDPGDLVLDPTCGSGTTAYVAEQWGRRWITVDTSRVALALARARIMGARYPYYLLTDSPEGQRKEAEVTRSAPAAASSHGDIRHGFVYQRVPHITLKSIANNAEIDVIWDRTQPGVEEALAFLNEQLRGHDVPFPVTTGGRSGRKIDFRATGQETLPSGDVVDAAKLLEWEVPREAPRDWPELAKACLPKFWHYRIHRQREIDASIAAKAEFEFLYDKPYEDKKRIRVAGPFTVESLSPHRIPAVDDRGDVIEEHHAATGQRLRDGTEAENYQAAILENLRKAGVHQKDKGDRIAFTSLVPWPGQWVAAEGRYLEGETERRAGVFIGPEYGTVSRADLVALAREAGEAGFDIAVACAFNFDAHASELHRLGRVPILQARMNPDLHMAGELKAGGGNLFTVFGEPDIQIEEDGDRLRVRLKGMDIFRPATGEVTSSEPDEIACWFLDTDYSGESFFVRHAYFPGAEVPYKALKSTLKGEIDEESWESLKRTVSRSFARPKSGRIAVKVINHLGDEVMKVIGL